MAELLHELILESACRTPAGAGLGVNGEELGYAALAPHVELAVNGLPGCMPPSMAEVRAKPLPDTPIGKVDRRAPAGKPAHLFGEVAP